MAASGFFDGLVTFPIRYDSRQVKVWDLHGSERNKLGPESQGSLLQRGQKMAY